MPIDTYMNIPTPAKGKSKTSPAIERATPKASSEDKGAKKSPKTRKK